MIGPKRMYVPLTDEEFTKLSQAASRACRRPRDQARYLIRQALGLVALVDEIIPPLVVKIENPLYWQERAQRIAQLAAVADTYDLAAERAAEEERAAIEREIAEYFLSLVQEKTQ